MRRVDAHVHFNGNHPASVKLLDEMNVKIINICLGLDNHGAWRNQAERYGAMAKAYPEHYAWCTSFDLPRFDDRAYVDTVINQLDRDFHDGAIACKAWKNLGMEVKHPDGRWFTVDDPVLEPIFAFIAKSGKPLLTHIGEPLACWQPLDPRSPHYGYYSVHPQWHMLNRKDFLSHGELIQSRDNLVAKHPTLRVIAAHFACVEYDVAEVAKRLDKYPNMAVDTSARLGDMMIQPTAKVRKFFMDYQDRILWGTDIFTHWDAPNMSDAQRGELHADIKDCTRAWFEFLSLDTTVHFQQWSVPGLGLPKDVVEKVCLHNAKAWYPGV